MREFHEIFVGRTDVYGTYTLPKGRTAKRGTKFLGKGKTITEDLTIENYRDHVRGEIGLGIIPITPKTNSVSWFVIDVDVYDADDVHGDMAKLINKLNLPLVICNSKSGGAHLYCFLTEPAPAKDVFKIAQKFVKKLKLSPKTEIFPKQDQIKINDKGSWINLPYFGETRLCMGQDGHTELSMKEFLLYVEEMEVHPSDLEVRASEVEQLDSGSKAPPCIDRMVEDGLEDGDGRDNAMVHVAVYMKKRYPDDWQDRLGEFNAEHCSPPLKHMEMARIVRGGERKEYQYLCKQRPMCDLCNKDACLKREYGVGGGEQEELEDFAIDHIRKIMTEDPIYMVTIDGVTMRLKTENFFTFRLFRMEVFKQTGRMVRNMKPKEWEIKLGHAREITEEITAPEIVSDTGQIRHHFMEWTGQMIQAGEMNRVLEGYPVYRDKTIVFRGTDLISYIKRTGGRFEDKLIWLVLNEDGAEEIKEDIGGVQRRLWEYPVGELWFDPPKSKDQF